MVDFTIALFLQLGLLLLLCRILPGKEKGGARTFGTSSHPCAPNWEAAQRMIEREYGASDSAPGGSRSDGSARLEPCKGWRPFLTFRGARRTHAPSALTAEGFTPGAPDRVRGSAPTPDRPSHSASRRGSGGEEA
jgi:hypothetical protein